MNIEDQLLLGGFITIISTFVSCFGAYLIARYSSRTTEERRLDDLLYQINEFYMQFPKLEDPAFIKECLTTKRPSEYHRRYDAYCTIIFNFLERVAIFYKFNSGKISNFVHYKEMIQVHAGWWVHPKNKLLNYQGYKKEFCTLIEHAINGN